MTTLHYVDITYFNSLYNRNSTLRTHSEITFIDGCIKFTAGGHGYLIGVDKIVSIKPLEEDD